MVENTIKNIVFDMGNVLIPYDPVGELKKLPEIKNDEDIRVIINNVFKSCEWLMLDRGTITHDRAKEVFSTRLEKRLQTPAFYVMDNWHREFVPFEKMEDLIKKLKNNGYKIYLLSNVSVDYFNFRHNLPGIKYFDGEFVSCQWGFIKPDERVFKSFYSHFNLIPGQCFFIDDSPANIESARRSGMDGHIYLDDFSALLASLKSKNILL